MDTGIFITVKDIMKLTGRTNYNSCANLHRAIRESIADRKRKLTIQEYCNYEKLDFNEVWKFLRG